MIRGILMGAGFGRRIGTPKALLTLGSETFHARAARAFREAGLPVISVLNAGVMAVLPEAGPDETRVLNPDPDQEAGMLSSVRLGVLEARRQGAPGVVLLPVDHPLVTSGDIRAVADALAKGAAVVVPTHGGRRGHPVGLGRAAMDEATSDPAVATLRDVVRRVPGRVVEIPASAGVLVGINTREDLERASERAFR